MTEEVETASVRRIGVMPATAMNIIGMIGVGPFITLPIMLTRMGGPHIIYAWIIGAILAFCDGLVYAQFAAALPGTGGPYVYLQEAYRDFNIGRYSMGRLLSFVFIFQMILVAPSPSPAAPLGSPTMPVTSEPICRHWSRTAWRPLSVSSW